MVVVSSRRSSTKILQGRDIMRNQQQIAILTLKLKNAQTRYNEYVERWGHGGWTVEEMEQEMMSLAKRIDDLGGSVVVTVREPVVVHEVYEVRVRDERPSDELLIINTAASILNIFSNLKRK